MPLNSSHISRGNIFFRKGRLRSHSTTSSSESRGCRGKEAGFVLQVFRAQVRKFKVRSFMAAATIESVGFGLGGESVM
jgi:hypothetical protein